MTIWSFLTGQNSAKEALRAEMRSGRSAHAHLFEGPAGIGKRTAALLFLQTLMCVRPTEPDEPCGECRSCRRFAAARKSAVAAADHPDLIPLQKFDLQGQATGTLVGDQEALIPLRTIQYAAEQLHQAPRESAKRAVLIPEAQRLCKGQAEAANSFLKTLEEPPRDSIIVMTSSQPEAILETIVSRVRRVRFRRLSCAEVVEALRARRDLRSGLSTAALEEVGAMADGSVGRALALLDDDLAAQRRAVFDLLREAAESSPEALSPRFGAKLWALAEAEGTRLFEAQEDGADGKAPVEMETDESSDESAQIAESEAKAKTQAGWKRHVFGRFLEICATAFRDALVVGAEAEALLQQPDFAEVSRLLAAKFGEEGCLRVIAAIAEAARANRLYVRGDVAARALAGRLTEARNFGGV
jgi:DNA polymerase-3 subunit delta'